MARKRVRHYRQGGAVPSAISDDAGDAAVAAMLTADEPAAPAPPQPAERDEPDALLNAMQAQERAEQIQRETLAQIDRAVPPPQPAHPQISERRRAFIESHPELTAPENADDVMHFWRLGLRRGMPEDSAEIDDFVLNSLRYEHGVRALGPVPDDAAPPPRATAPPQARQEAPQPQPSVDGGRARQNPQPPAPAPERKPSMPMTAPVTRSEPQVSGSYRRDNTLTPEEQQIAQISFPGLTPAQANYEYFKNRERYRAMRASGAYSDDRRG